MSIATGRNHSCCTVLVCTLGVIGAGCTGGLRPTEFVNPSFDFAFVERVAILPLENHSQDRQAGVRATRLLITELLAAGAVDVVEPGQVQAVLDRLPGGVRTAPNTEQIAEIGNSLGVQAILFGSVSQSESIRSGTIQIPVVTLDIHMVETETGSAVWAATHTEKGGGLSAKLLGTGAEPISATTRKCARVIVQKLMQ